MLNRNKKSQEIHYNHKEAKKESFNILTLIMGVFIGFSLSLIGNFFVLFTDKLLLQNLSDNWIFIFLLISTILLTIITIGCIYFIRIFLDTYKS